MDGVSAQHAVIQFRASSRESTKEPKPYLMDLQSEMGTLVNGQPVPAGRYYELRDRDIIQFGNLKDSEFVLMHNERAT